MRFIVQLIAVVAVSFLGSLALGAAEGNGWLTLTVGVAAAAAAVPVYQWAVRRTERREPSELAGPGAARGLARGTAVGIMVFAALIGAIAVLGGYRIIGSGSVTGALGLAGIMAYAGVTEELMWRGILFRWIEKWAGTWIAFVLTGILFGLMHLLNPNASLWGAVTVAIGGGGMLAAAYIATRSLWLPIGLHFGWNLAGSALFSTEVSGNNTAQGLLQTVMDGPTLLTGGGFGPEASIFALLFTGAATAAFLVLAARRGNIVLYGTARAVARDKVTQ